MEDIKVLEELIKGFDNLISYRQKQAIESLIARNKELEEEVEEQFEGRRRLAKDLKDNYIPKSALQELLDIDEIDVVHCRLKRLLGDDN